MTEADNHLALLKLCSCPFLGPKKIGRLENTFHDLEKVFFASQRQLLTALSFLDTEKFLAWRPSVRLNELLTRLTDEGIGCISWHHPDYPERLKELSDHPPVIFYRGDISVLSDINKKYLAIVGSRKNTAYAEKILSELILPIVSCLTTISGLALGVDALAHRSSLLGQGKTVAVLGSGLSWRRLYPRAHCHLAKEIIESGGLLISEFLPDEPPRRENFPRRNRLIASLSEAVLVIEATEKSGSLITARYALEQGRDVWAIPGNIFNNSSRGTNKLIQEGALAVLNTDDIRLALNLEEALLKNNNNTTSLVSYQPTNDCEKHILNLVLRANNRGETIIAEKICSLLELDTAKINSTLTILELKGVIIETDSGFELAA